MSSAERPSGRGVVRSSGRDWGCCRTSPRLILEIDKRELLSVVVAEKSVQFVDRRDGGKGRFAIRPPIGLARLMLHAPRHRDRHR